MFITRKHLSRRAVLRGAGATLALPLLDCMVPALTALSQTAAAPARLRRLGVFYVPNGMSMGYWWPRREGPLQELPPTLRSLEALKDRVLLLGGLADKPADLMEGGGDHARSAGTFLTASTFKLTTGADVYAAVSMDQVAARELARETQLTSLELGIESNAMVGTCDGGSSCAYTNTVAWRTPTTPLPVERDPRAVFERLFGTSGSTDPAARLARLERDRTIIDAVSSELKRLERLLGAGDRAKVSEYLDSVRDVERRIRTAERQSSRELPLVDEPAGIPDDYATHAKLQMDLLALAYQTDLTRVSTFMLGKEVSGRAYPEIGVSDSHHPCRITRTSTASSSACTRSTSTTSSSSRTWWRGWRRCRRATARCWTTRPSSTGPASATATRTSTTTCPSRSSGGSAPGSGAVATCGTRRGRRSRTSTWRCSTGSACTSTASATARAGSRR